MRSRMVPAHESNLIHMARRHLQAVPRQEAKGRTEMTAADVFSVVALVVSLIALGMSLTAAIDAT